jgi:2-methylcitrate dehydratase PrpD
MTVERRLAEHVAGLRYDGLNQAARDAASRLFLDTLAAMLSGVGNSECREIVGRLIGDERGGRCTVAGRTERVGAGTAALANGILAHWCEWDDVHDAAGIHGSAVIFPVLLAAAEESGLAARPEAGREFVTAAVAAYEVAARIGLVMNANSFHGWMTTGAAAAIGAAGAAARLLGLDTAGVLSAMGIAATGGGLSRQPLADRTSGKNALCGLAAKNAIDAARMAAAGIVGAPHFFAGIYGISALHAGGKADIAPLLGDLGERFLIIDAGVKAYPSCRSTHPSIDLMLDLLAERPGIGAQVESVAFTVPDLPFALCGRPFTPGDNPRVSAQFSIAFTTALALIRGAITPQDFLPDNVLIFADEYGALIRATTVAAADPPIGAQKTVPARARVTLKSGEVIQRATDRIKGSVLRPLGSEEEWQKLSAASTGLLDEAQCERLRAAGAGLSDAGPASALKILRSVQH